MSIKQCIGRQPLECILFSFLLDGRDYKRLVKNTESGLSSMKSGLGRDRRIQYLEYLRGLLKAYSKLRVDREALAKEVLDSMNLSPGSVLFLPGNFPNTEKDSLISDHTWANGIAKKYGAFVLAENWRAGNMDNYHNSYHMFPKDNEHGMSPTLRQQFSTRRNISFELAQKLSESFTTSRTASINSFNISVIICGENNILKNRQLDLNQCSWAYDEAPLPKTKNLERSIVFNPLHTCMGNAGKMNKRFEFITSKRNHIARAAIVLANRYPAGRINWPSNGIAIFTNGRRVVPERLQWLTNIGLNAKCIACKYVIP